MADHNAGDEVISKPLTAGIGGVIAAVCREQDSDVVLHCRDGSMIRGRWDREVWSPEWLVNAERTRWVRIIDVWSFGAPM